MCDKICVFCGHRTILDHSVEGEVRNTLLHLIKDEGFNAFYSGHMGEFDELCEGMIRSFKNRYDIKLYAVLYNYSNSAIKK